MPDPTKDALSPEDIQALIHTQQQMYAAQDPRAGKLYNYITQAGYATKGPQGELIPQGQSAIAPNSGGRTLTGEPAPGDTRNAFQRFADNINTPDPRREEWQSPALNTAQDFGRHLVAPVLQTIAHPINTAKGMLQAVANSGGTPEGFARQLIQPIVENAINDYQQHGPIRAATNLAATAGGTWAGGEIGGGITRGVLKAAPSVVDAMAATADMPDAATVAKMPNSPVEGQNYTPAHAHAFEGAITKTPGMGRQFVPQEVTPLALTPMRETAARMAVGTPEEQAILQTATNPKQPLPAVKATMDIVQNSLNDLESQIRPVLAKLASTSVDPTSLVQWLRSKITPSMEPSDANAIMGYAMRASQATTMDELFRFKSYLDKETSGQWAQTPVKEGSTAISNQIANELSGRVRNFAYDNMTQASGIDFQPLKLHESGLLKTLESLQTKYSTLAQQEAAFNAPTSLKSKIGTGASVIQNPKTVITQNLLRESPATPTATLLSKSLSDLPQARPLPAPPPTGPNTPIPPRFNQPQLQAQSGGPLIPPFHSPMTPGEYSAAMMHNLRRVPQAQLPAQVQPIPLLSSFEELMRLRNSQ